MLRITSDEDRLVRDVDMKKWFDTDDVTNNEGNYNFYITTDFATSEKQRADYSVISCWAYNSNDDWMLVDGECGRNLMDKNIDILFDFVVRYNVAAVGVEVTGQQGAFVTWIKKEMHKRNIYFTIVEVRPSQDKLRRFHNVVPLFRQKKMWFSKDLIGTTFMKEMQNELERATVSGFKSRHDDAIDTVSMLAEMSPWKPQHYGKKNGSQFEDPFYDDVDDGDSLPIGSYIV
jgi:predicted phage terminase large subunit-like protein